MAARAAIFVSGTAHWRLSGRFHGLGGVVGNDAIGPGQQACNDHTRWVMAGPGLAGGLTPAQLRALAVFPGDRIAALPQVDSMEPWQAILMPRGTREPALARLKAALATILADPEERARFAAIDLPMMGEPQRGGPILPGRK